MEDKQKKKVFFLLSSMDVGGVEKSFLNLIRGYDSEAYELHLGLYKVRGGYLDWLPPGVIIHHIDCYEKYKGLIDDPPATSFVRLIKQYRPIAALRYLRTALLYKWRDTRLPLYDYMMRDEPMLDGEFDIAVAYASPSERTDYYVSRKVKAKDKYIWIHFDITKYGCNPGIVKGLYPTYKKIFVVSQAAKEAFDRTFPALASKTEVRQNVVDRGLTVEMAASGPTYADSHRGLRILTVGRISPEKGQDMAVEAAAELKSRGVDFRWYFVGDGNFKSACLALAERLGVTDRITCLGLQVNPYAYMRDCDIYVQPSRHEGFCLTLGEAICFGHPIVATDFCGAREQLADYSRHAVCAVSSHAIATAVQDVVRTLPEPETTL